MEKPDVRPLARGADTTSAIDEPCEPERTPSRCSSVLQTLPRSIRAMVSRGLGQADRLPVLGQLPPMMVPVDAEEGPDPYRDRHLVRAVELLEQGDAGASGNEGLVAQGLQVLEDLEPMAVERLHELVETHHLTLRRDVGPARLDLDHRQIVGGEGEQERQRSPARLREQM